MNANPSINPADLDSLTGAFRSVFAKLMQSIDTALPAQVIAYNRNEGRVQVRPLIAVVATTGEQKSRAQIASVPVLQIGGGGFYLNFNLSPGDLGWLLASDRDISLFLQSKKEAKPNTFRVKNFADSIFIPVVLGNYAIAEEDASNAVLQSENGTVKISFGNDKIKIAAPNVEIATESVAIETTTVNVVASTSVVCTTPIFAVDGDITASGDITPHVPPP